MVVSILVRRLRQDKTYADFERAWMPEKGFGVPTRVISLQRMDDPREIVTIGFTDIEVDDTESFLEGIASQEQRRHDRIDEVIEPGMTSAFYTQVGDHDLTDAPPTVWAGAGLVERAPAS